MMKWDMVPDFKTTQERRRDPITPAVKVNFDAAIDDHRKMSWSGIIIRQANRHILNAFTAEATAAIQAISFNLLIIWDFHL
ncbi:hypothetical protein PVK06_041140 [Gossypium arboreum]|uniref:Uncharacterized protein n=1 Tax=Gossypium arboreum TaxID=29729 RepID=A0ABR0N7D4_GOSAR|nr:hypothetical protein PVK06_041140 [Gossypium arboreum]